MGAPAGRAAGRPVGSQERLGGSLPHGFFPVLCFLPEDPVNRIIIVARIAPGARSAVAELFRESDATALPRDLGVKRRSLYSLSDIYLHAIDFHGPPDEALRHARELPAFQK